MTRRIHALFLAPCLVFGLSLRAQHAEGAPAPAAQVQAVPEAATHPAPTVDAGTVGAAITDLL